MWFIINVINWRNVQFIYNARWSIQVLSRYIYFISFELVFVWCFTLKFHMWNFIISHSCLRFSFCLQFILWKVIFITWWTIKWYINSFQLHAIILELTLWFRWLNILRFITRYTLKFHRRFINIIRDLSSTLWIRWWWLLNNEWLILFLIRTWPVKRNMI